MQHRQVACSEGGQYQYMHPPHSLAQTATPGVFNVESGGSGAFSAMHRQLPPASGGGASQQHRRAGGEGERDEGGGGGQQSASDQGGGGGGGGRIPLSKGGEDDHKKVNLDESPEIHGALVEMLRRCNEEVDNGEVDESQRNCKLPAELVFSEKNVADNRAGG